ncbi:MAG: hypothetical protein AAFV53_31415 [Myxococcota bacterium]
MRLSLLIPLTFFTGCSGVTITNDWSGTMTCDNNTLVVVELDLDEPSDGSDDELEYRGDFFYQTFADVSNRQGEYQVEVDWQGSLRATQPEPEGAQDIEFILQQSTTAKCRYYQDDELLDETCYFNGLPLGYEFVSEHEGDWDGLNEMDFGNLNCTGAIERDDPIEE